jgi:ribonuclease-3
MSSREWLNYVDNIQGSIVTCPGRRPSSIRMDQLDRDQIISKESYKNNKGSSCHFIDVTYFSKAKIRFFLDAVNKTYPLIIHFSMFRNNWLPLIKNNAKIKKLYHKYFKLRHLLNNKSKPTMDDKNKLRALGEQLQSTMKKSSEVQKEIMIEISSENFFQTGIRTDIVQQAVLVPTLVEHLRFHLSLKYF